MPWVTVGVVTGVVSWAEAGATWHLAAGGTTGLAVGVCLCLSLAGMQAVLSGLNLNYLCGNVDVRFEQGVLCVSFRVSEEPPLRL